MSDFNMWRPWENISDRTINTTTAAAGGGGAGIDDDDDQPPVRDNVTQEEEPHNSSRNNKLRSQTLSKQCQQLVCNVYDYVKENNLGRGSLIETAKAVKFSIW
ncbi:hypothetical protein L9F63_004601 [Diploptera punctata]|uniref:Uncharacterized protein n=1 Tax=Diploptera punctata TaxID=6984 RepID=A0AAD8E7N3_DIPPU|nr:hypothetical protein L9F63_004601 [Diploptera punctata]